MRGERPLRRRSGNDFLVGAAIGTGMAALSAVRGGADFLLALSAGRIRTMGEPSICALLPFQEANDYVFSFAEREILPRVDVDVFFGAAVFDPRQSLEDLVDRIVFAGFAGVTNFPTACFIDGSYRRMLETTGLGFSREMELLSIARRKGLKTLAYTHTVEEARRAARDGADIVNIALGWNMGGVKGVETEVGVEEAALAVQASARAVRSVSQSIPCVVEGGPIIGPKQLEEMCRIAAIDGYIGGSTIDRVPLESAMEVMTSAFKAIGALRSRIDGLERELDWRRYPIALRGSSQSIRRVRTLFSGLLESDDPVLIAGEPGTGRRSLAEALHAGSFRRSRELEHTLADPDEERFAAALFGAVAGSDPSTTKMRIGWLETCLGSSLVIEAPEHLGQRTRALLRRAMETGRYNRIGSDAAMKFDTRIIGLCGPLPPVNAGEGRRTGGGEAGHPLGAMAHLVELPALRERLEDLPAIVEAMLARTGGVGARTIDPAAFRLLETHDWPGNLTELRSVLERACLSARNRVIQPDDLPDLRRPVPETRAAPNERDWILEALRRNRFRRGETAIHLGISRKTLYNKMRQYGLMGNRNAN